MRGTIVDAVVAKAEIINAPSSTKNSDKARDPERHQTRKGNQWYFRYVALCGRTSSPCDPALIKAIARGRAWFEELSTGRARSLQELAKRDGISRRYIRCLVGLAFLSPQLIEAILLGRQPVALTATRLSELHLPLDWTEQHKLLAG